MSDRILNDVINTMQSLVKNELPVPSHEYGHYEDHMVEMRDGIKLTTRVLFPNGEGPWPVILVRNPYSPVNSDLHMQQPIFVLVKFGYVIVYQQVRGAFESEGNWLPFENERDDGLDALKWIISQPWMNSNIGTFGGSYLGHVQWCMADQLPVEVKTMYFSIYGGDPYEGYYKNGMFRFGGWVFWAMEMMEPHRNLDVDPVKVRSESIERFKKILSKKPHISVDEKLFGQECKWYRNWITNTYPDDDYWAKGYWGEYQKVAECVNIPVMIQTGWFDFFLDSMVKTYLRLSDRVRSQSRFVISPWHHGNIVGGDLQFPNDNILGTGLVKDALEWFDHHLKGKPYNHPKGVVETYVMGENKWKTWNGWIQSSGVRRYFLNGYVADSRTAGELVHTPVEGSADVSFMYDPDDPVITRGGNLLINYPDLDLIADTSIAQEPPGTRQDIITFLSEPLDEELRITGSIKAHLFVSSDVEDTSFTVKLIEVYKDGRSNNIQDGINTLVFHNGSHREIYCPGSVIEMILELTPTTWTMRKGSKIRLDISSSNFPAFHIHPNVAGIWSMQEHCRIAKQTVFMGKLNPSHIEIPFSD